MTPDAQDREAQERAEGFYIGASISEGSKPASPDERIPHRLLRLGDQSGEVVEWLTLNGHDLATLNRQLEDGRRYRDLNRDLPALLAEAEKRGRVAAARETEQAWQFKGWADVRLPKTSNPIADAQRVTEWLRARADQEETR